jgi:mono/diheme cytochrome c family protein
LNGEGAKVQPGWFFSFLKGPVPLRPWLKIRMPTFGFEDAEATKVAQYFSAQDAVPFPYVQVDVPRGDAKYQADSQKLFGELRCLQCHTAGKLPEDPSSAAPDLTMAKSRLRPEWVPRWLEDPQSLMDGTRMPSFFSKVPDEEGKEYLFSPAPHIFPEVPDKERGAFQIRALRDYLFHLGEPAPAAKPAAGKRTAMVTPPPPPVR